MPTAAKGIDTHVHAYTISKEGGCAYASKALPLGPTLAQDGNRVAFNPALFCHFEELPVGNLLKLSANINKLRRAIDVRKLELEERRGILRKETNALREISKKTEAVQKAHEDAQTMHTEMERKTCDFSWEEATKDCSIS